jgi:hypothetical protein
MNDSCREWFRRFLWRILQRPFDCLDACGARELQYAVHGASVVIGISGILPDVPERTLANQTVAQSYCLKFGGNGPAFGPLLEALEARLAQDGPRIHWHQGRCFEQIVSSMAATKPLRPGLYIGIESYFGLIQFLRGSLLATELSYESGVTDHRARLSKVEDAMRRELAVEFGDWHELIRLGSRGVDCIDGLERFLSLWSETRHSPLS